MSGLSGIALALTALSLLRVVRLRARRRLEQLRGSVHVDRESGLAGEAELEVRIESELHRIDRIGGSIVISMLQVPPGQRAALRQQVDALLAFPDAAFRLDDTTFAILEARASDAPAAELRAVQVAAQVGVPAVHCEHGAAAGGDTAAALIAAARQQLEARDA